MTPGLRMPPPVPELWCQAPAAGIKKATGLGVFVKVENRLATERTKRRMGRPICSRGVVLGAVVLAAALSACQSLDLSAFSNQPGTFVELPEAEFFASDEALARGKEYFHQGDYGRAEAAYRRAVELMPNDPEALLGLAASYDRLRRFDLADRAYNKVAPHVRARPEYYNNLGYSYVLRGDLRTGRTYLLKAYELDPNNPVIVNNLTLLKNSVDYPVR